MIDQNQSICGAHLLLHKIVVFFIKMDKTVVHAQVNGNTPMVRNEMNGFA